MNLRPKPQSLRALALASIVFALSFSVYFLSVDTRAPSFFRVNFVFDADIKPVAKVFADGYFRNLSRHPLYAMFLGLLGSQIDRFVRDALLTARGMTACAGALTSVIAFWFFHGLLRRRMEAVLFCALASLAASVWVFAAVPETHIFNYASVVIGFWLLHRVITARRTDTLTGTTAIYVAAAVFLTGITVTNIVYITLSYLVALSCVRTSFLRRARLLVVYFFGVVALLWVFSAIQSHFHPEEFNLFSSPSDPVRTRFFRLDRPFSARAVTSEARTLLYNNVIASRPKVDVVPTVNGVQQMIQFGAISKLEIGILAYLGVFLALLLGNRSRERERDGSETAPFGPLGLLAAAIVAFNLVLHYFFHGHGQPFIFSVHTVFPVIVSLAWVYDRSRLQMKPLLLGGLLCAIVVNNAWFVHSVNGLLARRCVTEYYDDYKICTEWEDGPQPESEGPP